METQLYPLAAGTTSSCASQDFDFLNYWVDQTVEKEIIRGKKLRELKERPKSRKDQYDVINIGNTNIYSERKRRNRRSKSPTLHVTRRKYRKNSPHRKNSPTRLKRDSKSSRQRCPMRIAELAVPSKRQCIDTWRNKYHILPGIMIDRLRQHVLDLNPVVKIPDAIECFKRHKNAKKKKRTQGTLEIEKKRKNKNFDEKTKNKGKQTTESQYFCAIFGHRISKLLIKPVKVLLNSELQKISNVVSIEIEKLVNKGKRPDTSKFTNKRMHAEVAGKVTIWIANILQESAYKVLEDQLKDLEEEVGPVFDLLDDLVDSVVDVCEPAPWIEEISSSETYQEEFASEDNYEDEIGQITEQQQEETIEELYGNDNNVLAEDDLSQDREQLEGNLDDYIKNELDNIINSFDGDMSTENEDYNINTDIVELRGQDVIEFENVENYKEQNEFVDANDSFEDPTDRVQTNAEEVMGHRFEAEEEVTTIPDQGILNTDQGNDAANEPLTDDDSNKKVKFSDINMVTNDDSAQQATISQTPSRSINQNLSFSSPNDHLLSDADESWPDDMLLPILRPSESVSKSITSLGKIMETEEKMSIMYDDDTSPIMNIVINKTIDSTQLVANENSEKSGLSNAENGTKQINEIITDPIQTDDANLDNETINIGTSNIIESLTQQGAITKDFSNDLDELIESSYKEGKVKTDDTQQLNEKGKKLYDDKVEKLATEQESKDTDTETSEERFDQDKVINSEGEKGFVGPSDKNFAQDKEYIHETKLDKYQGEIQHHHSLESTFDHNVPTEAAVYEPKLDKILEDKATTVSDVKNFTSKKVKTADKEMNTSCSLVQRQDKSTSVTSQSLGHITKRFRDIKAADAFSSLRIKPKVDYKVHANALPSWVTRNYGEPSDSFNGAPSNQKKGAHDHNIRMWGQDLKNGFENLELWNTWIDNTLQSIKVMERKKARICIDKSREEFVRDWLQLKQNVDADVLTWTKLSKTTQEKLKGFRKIYRNTMPL